MKSTYAKLYKTHNKQSKIAVTFLTGYNRIFIVSHPKNKLQFATSFTDEDRFIQLTIPPGVYEIESFNNEFRRTNIEEGQIAEVDYPFKIKPNMSTLGFFPETSKQEQLISFFPDDSIRDILGFIATTIYEEYSLSPNPFDILTFDNIFLEYEIAQGMIFKGRTSGMILHIFTMDVDPGYEYIKKLSGGVTWYMLETKDFISHIGFELRIGIRV